ncbi:hypothetical protein G6038_25010 [Rhodococcus sp. 14C212]|uniref:Zn-ribbon domain-containing OB-fold protein n=1 Tax=Rhodococcus sp. 14C212 TaxID=2711209 RepID=UPI0013EB21B5|nr:OB-fold domain-containing protein [Rhodococcus sp. 14C212]NGP08670.1 hypothetical protein [Rhodococcus sp. 14C212]
MSSDDELVMERPRPLVDEVSKPFWEACTRRELAIQRCTRCCAWSYPAKLSCGECQSPELAFETVSGMGTLYSYTVQRQAFHAGFLPHIPNVVAMAELDDCPGVLLVANLVDIDVDDIAIGLSVRTDFDVRAEVTVPMFRPRHSAPRSIDE